MTDTNNTDGAALLPVTQDTRLWCLHHIGADEVHPAPDFETAWKWAIWANERFADAADICRFTVSVWPWSADQHAADLAASIADWTLPATQEDAERSGVGSVEVVAQAICDYGKEPNSPSAWANTDDFSRGVWRRYAMSALAALSTPQRQEYDGAAVREAEAWLRAISDWLLANDHDMTLPSGVLDTDPLDIADRLTALAHPAQATPSALSGETGERTCPMDGDPCSNPSCSPGTCFPDSPGRNLPSHQGAGE